MAGGVRQHRVARRRANGAAHALGDDQSRGNFPPPGESEQRHCEEIERVAGDRDRPVALRSVSEPTRQEADGIADQFSETRDDADDGSRRAKNAEIGSGDAARALIGHVGEKTDHAEHDDEPHRRRAPDQALARGPGGCRVHAAAMVRRPKRSSAIDRKQTSAIARSFMNARDVWQGR